MSTQKQAQSDRNRVNLTLTDNITKSLDRCADLTGQTKTALIMQAVVEYLPVLVERADALERAFKGGKR